MLGVECAGDRFGTDEEGSGDVLTGYDGCYGETEVSPAHYGDADWVGWRLVVFVADH